MIPYRNAYKGLTGAFVMPFDYSGEDSIRLLKEAVLSVFDQTDSKWLLFIICDGLESDISNKNYLENILNERRVILLNSGKKVGPGLCRNIGCQFAYDYGCEIILFLDSDDVSLPLRLTTVKKAFNDNECGVVYSDFNVINLNGNLVDIDQLTPSLASIKRNLKKKPLTKDAWIELASEYGYTNLTSATSVLTKYALMSPFPPTYVSEDFHVWLNVSAQGAQFHFIDLCLSNYRVSSNKSSRSRELLGKSFHQIKAKVDSLAFEEAVDVAQRKTQITSICVIKIRKKFIDKLVNDLLLEGESNLAKKINSYKEYKPLNSPEYMSLFEDLNDMARKNNEINRTLPVNYDITIDRSNSFKEMQKFATQTVPFYRIRSNIYKGQSHPLELPLIDKSNISDKMLDLCSDDLKLMEIFRHRTSGTTGEPITAFIDKHDWHMNLISMASQFKRLGFDYTSIPRWSFIQVTVYSDGRSVQIKTPLEGHPIWRRLNIPGLPNTHDEQKNALINLLAVFSDAPCVLNGMPSVLVRVGEMLKHYFKKNLYYPALVVTSGEALTENQRLQITSSFKAPTFSFYSAGEVGCIGFECIERNGFHIESRRLFVEIAVPDNDNFGEVIVTTLENKAMPLFKYKTGDYSSKIYDRCNCGDPRPKLRSIIGRSRADYLAFFKEVTKF